MANINKYIKALLHPTGGHQGSHKAHQAGNHYLSSSSLFIIVIIIIIIIVIIINISTLCFLVLS